MMPAPESGSASNVKAARGGPLLRRQVGGLLRWAERFNLLEKYKRDIKATKRNSWKNLCGHLKEMGLAAKLFKILRNSRQVVTHNFRRSNDSYTARPGGALDCLLD